MYVHNYYNYINYMKRGSAGVDRFYLEISALFTFLSWESETQDCVASTASHSVIKNLTLSLSQQVNHDSIYSHF